MIQAGPASAVLRAGKAQLRAAGVPSADSDAAALIAHVLGCEPLAIGIAPEVSEQQAGEIAELLARRSAREPLQHILGSAPFYGLSMVVGPGVFIPRPETELLVQAALAEISGKPRPTVVDLCAGSGAIGIAIAVQRPAARVIGIDSDADALRWLMRNAGELAPQLEIVPADVTAPWDDDALIENLLLAVADVVVCNPPYVPATAPVEPEVADYDPPQAVFAGADGLEVIPAVIDLAARMLTPGGLLVLEHDASHQPQVAALFEQTGYWDEVTSHDDLAGRPRFVTARRSADS